MLVGETVDLEEMLACRERRAAQQQEYLVRFQQPLISFCLNIPGPVKTTPELLRLFTEGREEIFSLLTGRKLSVLVQSESHAGTGDELLLCVKTQDAAVVKSMMTDIEEKHPLGRLFDIDVLDAAGKKLSRPVFRRCLLCNRQAQECARSRRHTVPQMQAKIAAMLTAYYGGRADPVAF
jgi:holo-ACP synthase